MLRRMSDFFRTIELRSVGELEEVPDDQVPVLSCVLILHIAFLDMSFPKSEQEAVVKGVMEREQVSEEVAQKVVDVAEVIRVSVPKFALFIDIVNKQLSIEERIELYKSCWELILSDGKIEPVELRSASEFGRKLGLTLDQETAARESMNG